MEIFQTVSNEHLDYSNKTFYFVGDNGYVAFHQLGSWDLVFTAHKFDNKQKTVSFAIDKDKYPLVQQLIDSMFEEIEKLKYLRGTNRITEEYQMLFKNGFFNWQSDAPASECLSDEFVYHYFNIYKKDGVYTFEFVCGTDSPFFSVEVNTDRSRYWELRFPVWDFFNKLKDVCCTIEFADEGRKILSSYHDQYTRKRD